MYVCKFLPLYAIYIVYLYIYISLSILYIYIYLRLCASCMFLTISCMYILYNREGERFFALFWVIFRQPWNSKACMEQMNGWFWRPREGTLPAEASRCFCKKPHGLIDSHPRPRPVRKFWPCLVLTRISSITFLVPLLVMKDGNENPCSEWASKTWRGNSSN